MPLEEKVPPSCATGATTSTPKPECAPERGELLGGAGAALAIGEVVADHDMGGAEPLRHHFGGEGLGAQRRQLPVEGDDEGLVEAERSEQLELERQRRQAEERLIGREEVARMRLEHDGARAPAFSVGDPFRLEQNRLMAAMDAVEIADGEGGTLERARHVLPGADNVHHASFALALLARGPAVDHHQRLAVEDGLAVDGAVARQA